MASVAVRNNIIYLNKSVDGKQYRLSTGERADDRKLRYYKTHLHDEFKILFENKYGVVDNLSFIEYAEQIVKLTNQNRNEFSQREELIRVKKLSKWFNGIQSINASLVARWQSECGYAPKTIRNYRGTLGSIIKMAIYDGILTKNPLNVVKAPKMPKREVFAFSEDEVAILLKNAKGGFHNLLKFNFFSGLRGSELIALRWTDVDFEEKTLIVSKRIREGKEDVTKSKTTRVLDLLPQAIDALREQRKLTGLSEHIFLNQYGRVYKTPNVLTESLKKLCIKSGLRVCTFHTTRKTCNTLLKQYNLPNDWILKQIGHTKDAVNREHYTGKIKPDFAQISTVLAHC